MEIEIVAWSVADDAPLLIEEWPENAIVYNPKSGETHQLNELAVVTLKRVRQEPVTLDMLIQHVCTQFHVEDESDLSNQLQRLITEFDNLGLVEPCCE